MNNFDFIAGPTGGLAYHFNALRFRRHLWSPLLRDVRQWLEHDWNPKERELLIFGPSAGWTIPPSFLEKFEKVICVEPDPVARAILRLRFRKTRFEMISNPNILPWFSKADCFRNVLNQHKNASVLFANLLGQLPLLWSVANVSRDRAVAARHDFLSELRGRTWASYHDIISARAQINSTAPRMIELINTSTNETTQKIALQFFSENTNVVDHETLWLSENYKTLFSTWEIRPGRNHVIGFVHT
jgi:hypothetical protein